MRCVPFLSLAIASACLLIACKKDKGSSSNSDPQVDVLAGEWRWVMHTESWAVNGPASITLTPQNTGITEFLHMNTDSTWFLVQNGLIVNGGNFKFIELLTPAWPIISLDFIGRSGKDSTVNHWLSNDTLWTSNQLIDTTYNVDMYVRQNE